jgi:hypothetical protein
MFSRDPNMEADVGYPPLRDGLSGRRKEDYEEEDDDRPQPWRGANRYILAGSSLSLKFGCSEQKMFLQ